MRSQSSVVTVHDTFMLSDGDLQEGDLQEGDGSVEEDAFEQNEMAVYEPGKGTTIYDGDGQEEKVKGDVDELIGTSCDIYFSKQ